jgi:hypothetical protein
MTIEELITKIEFAGFRVANLFQYEEFDGKTVWQANIYMPEQRYEYAKADQAVEALKEALAIALGERRAKAPERNRLDELTLEDLDL